MNLRSLTCALLCCVSAGVQADAEHDRIMTDRAAANARLAEQVRECGTRFVVSPCLEEARKQNRAALAELRQREIRLDESRRRAAAEARRTAIADKAEALNGRGSDVPSDEARARVRRESPALAAPVARSAPLQAKRAPESALDRSAVEQRSQARFEARAREAQAHREAVTRRNAQRAAEGKVVAPLPVPTGASAPR